MITNINKGICQNRLQNNKPSYFVNWQENEKQEYKFLNTVFEMYQLFDKLNTKQIITLNQ